MNNMYGEGQNRHASQGKLVLSNSPEGTGQSQFANDQTSFMSASNFQSSFMPGGAPPFATGGPAYSPIQPKKSIFQKLRSDPVYQVLAVAIVVVLIASSAMAAFAAMNIGSNSHNHANQSLAKVQPTLPAARPTQIPTMVMPTQAPTPVPTQAPAPVKQQPAQPLPTPGGNPSPTPGGNPSPTPGGVIPIQFVNPPQQASPDTYYPITVKTQPGLTVNLAVTYEVNNGPTGNYTLTADGNGIATLNWAANDAISYTHPVSVLFTATVQDGNGDSGQAQTTVIVTAKQ